MNYNIDKLINDIDFNSHALVKINDNLMLTNYQIEVLKRNDIDIYNCLSLKDVIYLAEEAYESTLDEELDNILNELVERNYYENTHK